MMRRVTGVSTLTVISAGMLCLLVGCGDGSDGTVSAQPIEPVESAEAPDAPAPCERALVAASTCPPVPTVPALQSALLVFQDEFTGTEINTTKWRVVNQDYHGNGALSAFSPWMVKASGGMANLYVYQVPWLTKAYSGGELDTLNRQTFQYGYFESRIKCPKGSGLHCSFWLWPDDNDQKSELDVVEIKGNAPTKALMTQHWPGSGSPDWGYLFQHTVTQSNPDFTQDYHVFGMAWSPSALVWYVDGLERARTSQNIPSKRMRLEVTLALDMFAGGVDGSTVLPTQARVDYVRVWNLGSIRP